MSLSDILALCEILSDPDFTGIYQLRRSAIYEHRQRTVLNQCSRLELWREGDGNWEVVR